LKKKDSSLIINHQSEIINSKEERSAMRNMLALFGAALLTVVGVGWYLGWYKVSSQPASVPGQHSVKIDIKTDKINTDLQTGERKIQQMLEKHDEAKKNGDLMLPSPGSGPQLNVETGNGSALQVKTGDKAPLFQFHTNKGASMEVGAGDKGPMLQFDAGNKGPVIQFGGGDKK
jgi:hypothetical protein